MSTLHVENIQNTLKMSLFKRQPNFIVTDVICLAQKQIVI